MAWILKLTLPIQLAWVQPTLPRIHLIFSNHIFPRFNLTHQTQGCNTRLQYDPDFGIRSNCDELQWVPPSKLTTNRWITKPKKLKSKPQVHHQRDESTFICLSFVCMLCGIGVRNLATFVCLCEKLVHICILVWYVCARSGPDFYIGVRMSSLKIKHI